MSCRDCVFKGIFQDMGASCDVCNLHTSLVDAVAACEHSDSCNHRFTMQEAKKIVIERNGGLPIIKKEKSEPKPNDHSDPLKTIKEGFQEIAKSACDAVNAMRDALDKIAKGEIQTRNFECDNGITYMMPKNHCVFCDHCTDIFYDFTNGPYLCLCDLGHDDFEICGKFESEEEK